MIQRYFNPLSVFIYADTFSTGRWQQLQEADACLHPQRSSSGLLLCRPRQWVGHPACPADAAGWCGCRPHRYPGILRAGVHGEWLGRHRTGEGKGVVVSMVEPPSHRMWGRVGGVWVEPPHRMGWSLGWSQHIG